MKYDISIYDCYLAGPWFTDEQMHILDNVKACLDEANINYFSPKDANLWKPGDNPDIIIKNNCEAIRNSDFIVAITDGKDVGTMWECGYAYGFGKQILYVWITHKEGQKFNIMLAASGSVCYSYEGLTEQLQHYDKHNMFIKSIYGTDYE